MAQVQRSIAALRIWGDDLNPAEITRLLGCEPSFAQTKGDQRVIRKNGRVLIASAGMWSLEAADREPEDLEGQIDELLSKLTADLSVWDAISDKYKLDLFCGLFLGGSDEGLSISPESQAALGLRHILLALCIYSGHDEDTRDDSRDSERTVPSSNHKL
ncbi:MAG: hypothetical protein JWO52_565 [Gammaproteobacteria bacterium]|jgi:hypothetical protein|nr:hypothetical protein [Gammaproteobacteria bacterium]